MYYYSAASSLSGVGYSITSRLTGINYMADIIIHITESICPKSRVRRFTSLFFHGNLCGQFWVQRWLGTCIVSSVAYSTGNFPMLITASSYTTWRTSAEFPWISSYNHADGQYHMEHCAQSCF